MTGATLSVVAIVANVIVPGAGLVIQHLPQIASFLAGINGKCDQLSLNEAHFKRVSSRLHELLAQLTAMENKGQLPSVQVVKRYAELLDSFDEFLSKYIASNFLARLLTQETVLNKITVFHQEVDELLKVLNLAHIAHMTDWRVQYDIDQKEESTKLTALLQSNRLLVEECTDARKQREAMLRLLHAMHRPNNSAPQKQLVKQAFQALQRLSLSTFASEVVPTWFIAPEEISISDVPFARGATAAIHHGLWRQYTPVVVKCFNVQPQQYGIEHEINLWFTLRHPHVLVMYGACHVGSVQFIVSEVAHTSLDCYSRNLNSQVQRGQEIPRFLWEAALGIQYLHLQNIVHGDLKCNNILVTSDCHVKIADFGCSFHLHSGERPVNNDFCGGGLRWTPPECLEGVGPRTTASDIYSLGLCFIEALTAELPFCDCTTEASVKDAIRSSQLPDLQKWPLYLPLVSSMCRFDPADRPDIPSIVSTLHGILESAPKAAVCDHCASVLLPLSTFCHSCGLETKYRLENAEKDRASNDANTEQVPSSSEGVIREYGYALKSTESSSNVRSKAEDMGKGRIRRRRRHSLHLSSSDIHLMVANHEIESLINLLNQAREAIQEKALQALLNMVSDAIRLVAAGILEPLIGIVQRGLTPTCKELSAALLGLLMFRRLEVVIATREKGGIQALVKLLRQGTFVQRSYALRGLAYASDLDENSSSIIVADGGLPSVYEMLQGADTLKENSLWILANVTSYSDEVSVLPFVVSKIVGEIEEMSYDQQAHALRLLGNSMAILPRKLLMTLLPLLVTLLRRQQHISILVHAIGNAAYLSDHDAELLVDAGAIPLLWVLAQNESTMYTSIVALANLAVSENCRCILSRNHGLSMVISRLKLDDNPLIQVGAMNLCHNLALETLNCEWLVELGAVNGILEILLVHRDAEMVCLTTLARLSMIDGCLESFVPVVTWISTQLLVRRRDVEFLEPSLIILRNTVTNSVCDEAFVAAGGIPMLLKLLNKAPGGTLHYIIATLANIATKFDSVELIVCEPETMYVLATSASNGSTVEKFNAMRCIANITYFEPASMRAIKNTGIPLLLEILTKPRETAELHGFTLATLFHMSHHPSFQSLLIEDVGIVGVLQRWSLDSQYIKLVDATLLQLGISRQERSKSFVSVAMSKIKRSLRSNNNHEDSTNRSPLFIQLEQKKTRLNAMHSISNRIPHDITPEDLIASGAFDLIISFLDEKSLRFIALRIVSLVLDHSDHISISTSNRLLPILIRLIKTTKGDELSMATEAAMTIACQNGSMEKIVAEITPEYDNNDTTRVSLLYASKSK